MSNTSRPFKTLYITQSSHTLPTFRISDRFGLHSREYASRTCYLLCNCKLTSLTTASICMSSQIYQLHNHHSSIFRSAKGLDTSQYRFLEVNVADIKANKIQAKKYFPETHSKSFSMSPSTCLRAL